MRIFWPRATIDPSRESIGDCSKIFAACGSASTSYFTEYGTLGGDFDVFAARGESTGWVPLRKTRSRPHGVRVCPAARFYFFSTTFDPRAWTMVAFWNEDSGRQPPLVTPENERGDETSSPSPPNLTFIDEPDVPFRPKPRGPFDQLRGPYPEPQDPQDPPDEKWISTKITSSSSTCWWRKNKSGGSIAWTIASAITITRASTLFTFK